MKISLSEAITFALTHSYGTKGKESIDDPIIDHPYNMDSIIVAYRLLYGKEPRNFTKAIKRLVYDGLWTPKKRRLNPSRQSHNI